MSQDGDLFHFRFLSLDQFIYLLLSFRYRFKASIVFIHLVEPKRFVFPFGRRRQHEFGSSIKQVDHVRFPLCRKSIHECKGIRLPAVFIMHGRSTFSLEEFKLDFLFHRDIQLVYFADSRFRYPERNDIIELSAHRRNETRLIVFSTCQQSIGKSFLADFIFNHIARFQPAQFQHDLTGAPVNGTGRRCIIAGLCNIYIDNIAIGPVNGCLFEFGKSRQRVIIIFDYMVGHPTGRCLYFKLTVNSKRSGACRLNRNSCTVQQSNAVITCKCRIL